MNKEKISNLIENCNSSLENFSKNPEKNTEELLLNLDSLERYLSQNDFPFLLEKVKYLFEIISKIKQFFEQMTYLDIDLLEELALFLGGALMELSGHANEILDKDSISLKNTHWQKIFFLRDWANEYLKFPKKQLSIQKEKFEKFMIFSIGQDWFSIPISSFRELVLLEKESEITEGKLLYKNEKIPLVDRNLLFGNYSEKYPKTILIFYQNNTFLGLEVDKLINSEDLNINNFIPIENITGFDYIGPIKNLAVKDNNPLFILNPPNSYHWPLTGK
ncbi:MAG: chemotaxis protein CheW [Bacteriovoracales bacterium]